LDVYKTEDEQVEQIKKWLKENGASLATGILIGLAVLFGGKAWTEYKWRQSEQASNIYTQLTAALATGNKEAAVAAESAITGDFSSSPYAVLGQLAMARHKLDSAEPDAARAHLQWALEHASMPELAHIARLRLARLLLAQGKLDEVKPLLSVTEEGAFAAAYDEIRGDLYLQDGDSAAAVAAYEKALAGLPADAPIRGLIETKRDNVPHETPDASE
jgi:predicted negative regulator of RcsB-dependent stress response